jgi:hypothetical protein
MDIVVWLRSLGLGKYEAAFRENEIDDTVLPDLTAEDLNELGVQRSGTAVSCWLRLRRCVMTRAVRYPLLTQRPRRVPQAHVPKTAPSAVRSR